MESLLVDWMSIQLGENSQDSISISKEWFICLYENVLKNEECINIYIWLGWVEN